MDVPGEFSKHMATLSNSELLKILTEQANEYQPEALVTAKEEMANRKLTPAQLQAAQNELKKQKEEEQELAIEFDKERLKPYERIWTTPFPKLRFFVDLFRLMSGYSSNPKIVRWISYAIFAFLCLFVFIFILQSRHY